MEEHFGKVTWTAPIEISLWRHARQAPNPWGGECPTMFQRMPRSRRFQIHRRIGQSCIGRHGQGKIAECKRIERVVADISDRTGCEKFRGTARHKSANTNRRRTPWIRGWLEPAVVWRGGKAKFVVAAEPAAGWHVYALAPRRHRLGRQANAHRLQPRRLFGGGAAVPDRAPLEDNSAAEAAGVLSIYDAPVRWTLTIDVPPNTAAGNYPLAGVVGFKHAATAVAIRRRRHVSKENWS